MLNLLKQQDSHQIELPTEICFCRKQNLTTTCIFEILMHDSTKKKNIRESFFIAIVQFEMKPM